MNGRPSVVSPSVSSLTRGLDSASRDMYAVISVQSASLRSVPTRNPRIDWGVGTFGSSTVWAGATSGSGAMSNAAKRANLTFMGPRAVGLRPATGDET